MCREKFIEENAIIIHRSREICIKSETYNGDVSSKCLVLCRPHIMILLAMTLVSGDDSRELSQHAVVASLSLFLVSHS